MAAPVTVAPVTKPVEMPTQALPGAAAPAPLAPPRAATTTSYTVKPGDTLTKIANANKSANVSLQQMLIALYRSNAGAFDGNNINRMRAGRILNIPDTETAVAVDQGEAVRTVSAQAAEFNEYRRKLGAAVAEAPARAESRRQSASGKITARVEDKPAAAKDAKDQLKLSKAETGKPGAGRSPQGLQEDLIAKEKALKEANERIVMLEKSVQDMKKLLEIKSQTGAQLQQQAAKAGAAKPAEAAKAPEPAKAPAPAKAADAAKAPEPAKPAEAAKAEDAAKAAPKPAAPKPPPRKVIAPPPPPPEPSLLDEILSNEVAIYGGGAGLLLLFVGYGYYAWRRKKTLQQMEGSAMPAPSLAVDSVFGAAGGASIDAGPGEIQGGISQGAAAAAIETEEVDPIAEADVYMAYGRDTQAEEILKEALGKDPSRQPIRVKLLEIYANRKDAKAFEAVATELHAGTNGAGAEWEKAAALGAQLDPENPLYGGVAEGKAHAVSDTQVVTGAEAAPDIVLDSGAGAETSPGLDFDLGGETVPGAAPQSAPAPATDVTANLGFDLNLGGEETKREAAPAMPQPEAPAESASIDFDFELPGAGAAAEPSAPQAPAEPAAGAPAAEGGGGIDFDFNLDVPAPKEEAPSAPLDLSAISLELGSPGEAAPAPDAHWQEVATKLDLAKAYQEMGDKDGARELLNEVLKEGDAAQQQQAQTVLAALG